MRTLLTVIVFSLIALNNANAITCSVECSPALEPGADIILDISSLKDDPHGDYQAFCATLGGHSTRAGDLSLSCRNTEKKDLLLCYRWANASDNVSASGIGSGVTLTEARENGRTSCLSHLTINDPHSCEVGFYPATYQINYKYDCN